VKLRRIIAAVLAAASLPLLLLTSCAKDKSAAVISYEGTVVTEAMYSYWISGYKNYFLQLLGGSDTEEYLTSEITIPVTANTTETMTVSAYLDMRIREIVKNNCISLYLFDSYGLQLPSPTVSAINAAIDSEIENAGGRKELNEALAPIMLNVNTLRQMYIADEKINYLYEYLYGDTSLGTTGAEPITNEQYKTFYEKNYVCVRHIYVRTVDKNVLDENGEVQYNEDGSVLIANLTEEEAAEKRALCDTIMQELENGADFSALEEKYSEDAGRHTLKHGYVISSSTSLPDDFVNNAFDMEIGEIRRVDASYATHIMLRCPLPENIWQDKDYSVLLGDFTEYVKSDVYAEKIASYIEKIVYNEALWQKHTTLNTPVTAY